MNIIIFGTGTFYLKYKNVFSDMHIVCFLDNDSAKWEHELEGKSIIPPNEITHYKYDYIFLMSLYFTQMREQLINLKVPEDKIIDPLHLGCFANVNQIRQYEIHNCRRAKQNKGRILLLSHSFNLSGAPVVLSKLARLLQEEGYLVEIYAKEDGDDGELLYQMLRHEIPVSIFARFDLLDTDEICRKYDIVIINTIILYPVIQKLSNKAIPVIWWLHEEEDVYCNEHFDVHGISVGKNIHVYAVGQRAKAAYEKYSRDSFADIMLYGIDEVQNERIVKEHRKKLTFALVGYGCERKGQDIVYDAVKRQLPDWENRIEVWFVGNILESKQKLYSTIPCIRCMGILSAEELAEVYNRIDVLLCPSLYDPMPVVVSEAMMHRKTCIVSDMTGQYEYIIPYVNGLTCRAGSIESLEAAMQWAIDNCEKLSSIGMAGYSIYKNNFSIDIFKEKALRAVAECLFNEQKYGLDVE